MLQDNQRLKGHLPELPSSIEKLDLRNCQLSGSFPSSWIHPGPGLPKLRALYLASRNSNLLKACESWAKVFTCAGGSNTGSIGGILHLPALTLLDVSGLPLACPAQLLLRAFGRSPLSTVRLKNTQLTGTLDHHAFHTTFASGSGCYEGPGTFYETLATLDLSDNSLSALQWNLFPVERPPPALQMLTLANNDLKELDPEWLMPSQLVLTGNPLLRSPMPLNSDASQCAQFWRQRHNGRSWNSEYSWDPCMRSRPKGFDCKAGLEGFTLRLQPDADWNFEVATLQMPRSVLADKSFSSSWDCSGTEAQSAAGGTEMQSQDLKLVKPSGVAPQQQESELASARINLLRLGLSPIALRAVKAAVALDLPRLLDGTSKTCQQLVASLHQTQIENQKDKVEGVVEGRLCRLLQALASLGLVELDPSTPDDAPAFKSNAATQLLQDRPANDDVLGAPPMKAFLEYEHIFDHYSSALAETITTGRTGPEILHGKSKDGGFFQVSEKENVLFDKAFSAIETRSEALRAVPWPKTPFHLCDVGGAAGVDADLLMKMGVSAKITILDVQKANPTFPEHVSAVVHNMFQPLPEHLIGACEFFWLDFVIQDFSDAQIASVLRHLRAAAPRTARLALLNHVLGAHGSELERFKREMDLWQMVAFGGRERSRKDFQLLLAAGGWQLDSVELIRGEGCVIVASAAADYGAFELDSGNAMMPGPWLGRIGSGRALAVWKGMNNQPTVAVVKNALDHGGHLHKQSMADMDFIGIWEAVIPLSQREFALLYCSKSLNAPAATIGKLVSNTAESDEKLQWLSKPSSFASYEGQTEEHFFANRPAVKLPCVMRISAAALSNRKFLVCYIREDPKNLAGAYCTVGSVASSDANVAWEVPKQLHRGTMAAPCSNLPMHKFATLKVVALTSSSWAVLYSDGALVRTGGRCDGKALQDVAHCEGGSCNLMVRLVHAGPENMELGEASQSPLGQLHMLDASALGTGSFVTCFLALTNFPSLQDEGRCLFAEANHVGSSNKAGIAGPAIHWGPAASLGPSAWDISLAVLSASQRQFVVAFERGYRGNLLIAMAGSVDASGQVVFGPPLEGSAPLHLFKAQRPSLAAVSEAEVLLAVADQTVEFQPVVVKMRVRNTSVVE
eukprot:gnl/MRDRNA2_/MRDRNA2_144825_c0_seq1.p1 gnl/MRDRNA2_/MRDRNA2_144825_c0~~gnl/MRDRNA2_/MRDRNA2_144825_c0_seq1.p1  ORF type:complete len:1134 (+),score=208.20 gnl/MRDRNA2_/MRDRNA2_144825_c0_seq1:2-3403(+)